MANRSLFFVLFYEKSTCKLTFFFSFYFAGLGLLVGILKEPTAVHLSFTPSNEDFAQGRRIVVCRTFGPILVVIFLTFESHQQFIITIPKMKVRLLACSQGFTPVTRATNSPQTAVGPPLAPGNPSRVLSSRRTVTEV